MQYHLSWTHNGQPVDVHVKGTPEALHVREVIERAGYTVGCNPPLPNIAGFRELFAEKR